MIERELYIDRIRILASFAVVFLHSSAQYFYEFKFNSFEWKIFNFYDSLVRFAVPLLFMISGALFLKSNKKIEIKKLYSKNILRLFTAYVFWSVFYAIFNIVIINKDKFILKNVIKLSIESSFHLWFLPVIISIYLLLPLLKKVFNKENMDLVKYFLILFMVFGILKNTVLNFIENEHIISMVNTFNPELLYSHIGYFVLGFYIDTLKLSKKSLNFIYLIKEVQ